MDEEGRLVEQARGGSEEAFAELLRRHQAAVRAFLSRYIRERETVRDLAQDAFLNAFRSLDTYRGGSPLRAWLFSIARNRALNHLRGESRRRTHETASMQQLISRWLAERLEGDGAQPPRQTREITALETCLKNLAPASASLVHEHYFRGRSAVLIARETGKRESAVWMTLSRIRQALRQCIELRLSVEGVEQ